VPPLLGGTDGRSPLHRGGAASAGKSCRLSPPWNCVSDCMMGGDDASLGNKVTDPQAAMQVVRSRDWT